MSAIFMNSRREHIYKKKIQRKKKKQKTKKEKDKRNNPRSSRYIKNVAMGLVYVT